MNDKRKETNNGDYNYDVIKGDKINTVILSNKTKVMVL